MNGCTEPQETSFYMFMIIISNVYDYYLMEIS